MKTHLKLILFYLSPCSLPYFHTSTTPYLRNLNMFHELVHRKYLLFFYCLQNFVVDIVYVRGDSRVILWGGIQKYWCQVATDFTIKYLSLACQNTNNNTRCERSRGACGHVCEMPQRAVHTHWNANRNIFSNLTQHFNNTPNTLTAILSAIRFLLLLLLSEATKVLLDAGPKKIILDNINVLKSHFLSTFLLFACHCHAAHLPQ